MTRPDWNRIREHYRRNTTAIYAAGASDWGIDPYAWDSEAGIMLSPIEQWLWQDLRHVSAVVYPQYPVAGYFVDFGNPVARVAIECDGAAFHTDRAKDARRQAAIEANGWTVYRFTGSECWVDTVESEDDNGVPLLVASPTRRRLREIVQQHGIRYAPPKTKETDPRWPFDLFAPARAFAEAAP